MCSRGDVSLSTLCYCAHWRWGFGVWRGSAVIRFYVMRLFVVLRSGALFGGNLLGENFMSLKPSSVVHL